MIFDPEKDFDKDEIKIIQDVHSNKGMNLMIFADWYNKDKIQSLHYYDLNTRKYHSGSVGYIIYVLYNI